MIILMKFHELRNNYDFCTCNVTCRSFIITCLVNETIINIFEHSDQVQVHIIRVSCRLGCPLIILKTYNDQLRLFSFFRVTKKVTVSPNCLSVIITKHVNKVNNGQLRTRNRILSGHN